MSNVHLGMRRLSIIDLEGGKQPMTNGDETLWIVFNGEIFNAPEIRKRLEQDGARFRSNHSDTEVLLALYERHGEEMLRELNGMFAFVIHDQKRNVLFGARDHFGIKPLFTMEQDGTFAFASELKALRVLPWFRGDLDHQAIADFFSFQTIPAPRTIYASCKKIPAGHCFTWESERKTLTVRRYWKPSFSSPDAPAPQPEEMREQFMKAVERWSQSDVPIACSLSGGLDSSAIVAALAHAGAHVTTYTLGFSDAPDLDERDLARLVSERYGTEHHEIVLKANDLLVDLDTMILALDEPYAGGLPSWFVFKEMGKNVKVAMTGTGGDELFGNYGKWLVFESWIKRLRRTRSYFQRGGGITDLLHYPHGALHYPYWTDARKCSNLFTSEFLHNVHPSAALIEELWSEGATDNPRDAVASVDLRLQLPEEFLMMTDRFSMAHSLEARTPFLDRSFADYVLSLPSSIRTSPHSLKGLFQGAIADLLPREHLTARKKGFILPVGHWLHTALRPLAEELCNPDTLEKQGIFNPSIYERYVRPCLDGNTAHVNEIWMLLWFQAWYERLSPSLR